MKQTAQQELPGGCAYADAQTVADGRGALTFVEGGTLPFGVERIFWITSVPPGGKRGGHAHRTCAEAVFAARGSFDIAVDDGVRRAALRVSAPGRGVIIPAGVWCELYNFTPGSVCVVAASERYDPEGYAATYEDFLRMRREWKPGGEGGRKA